MLKQKQDTRTPRPTTHDPRPGNSQRSRGSGQRPPGSRDFLFRGNRCSQKVGRAYYVYVNLSSSVVGRSIVLASLIRRLARLARSPREISHGLDGSTVTGNPRVQHHEICWVERGKEVMAGGTWIGNGWSQSAVRPIKRHIATASHPEI